jgi:hypothetical protein
MSTSTLGTSHAGNRAVRTLAFVTILAALTLPIVLGIAAKGPGAQSPSPGQLKDTSGAYQRGWSTRTGGNQTSPHVSSSPGHAGDTSGSRQNGWSTRTGGNVSAHGDS